SSPMKIAQSLNWFTLLGYGLFASTMALLISQILRRIKVWGATALAIILSLIVLSSRALWATALIVNPVPWSFFSLTFAAWLFLKAGSLETSTNKRNFLFLSYLMMGIAIAFCLPAILFVPGLIAYLWIKHPGIEVKLKLQALMCLPLPLLLFLLPLSGVPHPVHGLVAATTGIPMLPLWKLLGWTLLWTLTPAALPFVIYALYKLSLNIRNSVPVSLTVVGIVLGAVIGGEFSEYAIYATSLLVGILTVTGIAYLTGLLPNGAGLVTALTIPALMIGFGAKLDRSDEVIYPIHTRNALRTIPLEETVLAIDETLINTPYDFFYHAMNQRPDLAVINPLRLKNPNYLEQVVEQYPDRFEPVQQHFDALMQSLRSDQKDLKKVQILTDSLLASFIESERKARGVMISPRFRPPGDTYKLIPEGLFMRVVKDESPRPYHFTGLDLTPIKFDDTKHPLYNQIIAQYPVMLTARGNWMLKHEFIPEGQDYIRWAMQIDPDYTPVRLIAKEYGIEGKPRRLGM
ncbi:hypothetical protein K8I28_16550, partial [bacterium]|nr:hypothetical protein [bacterium]